MKANWLPIPHPRQTRTAVEAVRVGSLALLAMAMLALALALASTASADQALTQAGEGAGQTRNPQGLALDFETGRLYVADDGNHRIDVFAAGGSFEMAFGWGVANGKAELQSCGPAATPPTATCQKGLVSGGAGAFTQLGDIAVDNDPASASHHDVYVVDRQNGLVQQGYRVQKFDPDGDFLLTWGGGVITGGAAGAGALNTYGEATEARLPLVIGAFILFTLLALVVILRAPLLALLTVCLNLASVAAAIGVMTLICRIPEGYPLGGHPYVDTVGAGAIFGVTFGLSIDYAVFLIARMRERYDIDGDNRAAISYGLEKTAGVITGAAAIMAAVFVSFAAAPIATVSQMGVGLTVAILLDATVVRIVLLPALMLLLGDRVWHVPPLLDRILPRRNVLLPETRTTGA